MEKNFEQIRNNIIGINQEYKSPYGLKKILYADWIASGRLYAPIEKAISENFGPFVANTHTEASKTGTLMTKSYFLAHKKIKEHVNADKNDVIITSGVGMTTAINKLLRILGLKYCGKVVNNNCIQEKEKPVVFITHMEHHSNQTAWYETCADVVVLNPNEDLLVDLDELRKELNKYSDRKIKIGSFSACSNVTGIETPYHEMAKIMHENQGLCFVDFAASAPYIKIDMHPEDPLKKIDAIFFSPHKFLGGPGSSGVLIFDSKLYKNFPPDTPGGGTVDWTNPWGKYKYSDDIETREDGGTPGFLQAIRTALCIELKNQMGVDNIRKREEELVEIAFQEFDKIPEIMILANNTRKRLGVISFNIENLHYNLVVKLLSDRFGIQVRGGCTCAGTYGHFLLNVNVGQSKTITDRINKGDFSIKPGWVRLALHPTMTNDEVYYIFDAIKQTISNQKEWVKDYTYSSETNEFESTIHDNDEDSRVVEWFNI